ncbi:MAG: UDP-N-acetyl-D-glucosamine dehydrogenase [Candidatus Cloacimonetes bacterium 4572_55]|nr:MAG: UDP-N-acetyl-D-glucosamine dehydrogenase [Candidatus Cloacimonetes bacterium 4572_55]
MDQIKSSKKLDFLYEKVKNRSASVAVIGMGYVGLPLSIEYLKAGFRVTGIDNNLEKVNMLRCGKSGINDISDQQVKDALNSGLFNISDRYDVLEHIDIISICVPTPLNKTKDPDVSYILSAVRGVSRYLSPGKLVILESTTYPGTTEELILPRLEETGLTVGKDFFVAFSPERVDPGNKHFNTSNTPKIVGGITDACTEITRFFFEQCIDSVVPMSTSRAAEMVKLLENTFRSVNIGLVNEIAFMCDRLNIDVWEVINAAATKPFGFMPFYPGPGLGGHCIPIDPFYLSWKLKTLNYHARFIELAGDINSNMPNYVVSRISDMLNHYKKPINGSKVLILGVAYKENINDARESPALDIIKLMQEKGADVSYNDPFIPKLKLNGKWMESVDLTVEGVQSYDCLIITTAHSCYDKDFLTSNARLIFDSRNALKDFDDREKIHTL